MKHKKTIIGVMGVSKISKKVQNDAEKLGKLLAVEGYVVLTGGEPAGVMEYALKGAAEVGGETIGILPGNRNDQYSKFITIPIFTDSDIGRDYYNVLSSDALVVASPVSTGTLIEVAYALKRNVPIVLLNTTKDDQTFIKRRGGKRVYIASGVTDVVEKIKKLV